MFSVAVLLRIRGGFMTEKYFAASNSERGFVSYFGEIFNPLKLKQIYIIKGGPGTGKSYFMKRIAEAARLYGHNVELYYCSSDQASLDGLKIDGEIAFLDGTPPHSTDAVFPGAVENIVNLGAFWNPDKLMSELTRIRNLSYKKKQYYNAAYGYLSAYGALCRVSDIYTGEACDLDKIKRTAARMLSNYRGESEKQKPQITIIGSVGMEGSVVLDSFENCASRVISVRELSCSMGDISHLFMEELVHEAEIKNIGISISPDPIVPSRIGAVKILCDGTVFLTDALASGRSPEKVVSCERFIKKCELSPLKKQLKKITYERKNLLELAENELSRIKEVHFEIEDIYKSAMDFDAKEHFTEEFISNLFKNK